jgi:hypothetical protein
MVHRDLKHRKLVVVRANVIVPRPTKHEQRRVAVVVHLYAVCPVSHSPYRTTHLYTRHSSEPSKQLYTRYSSSPATTIHVPQSSWPSNTTRETCRCLPAIYQSDSVKDDDKWSLAGTDCASSFTGVHRRPFAVVKVSPGTPAHAINLSRCLP